MADNDSSLPPTLPEIPAKAQVSPTASDNDGSSVRDDTVGDLAESNTSVSSGIRSPIETGLEPLKSPPTTQRLGAELAELFTESVAAKIFEVAVRELKREVGMPPASRPP
jgi:hypothetical protein